MDTSKYKPLASLLDRESPVPLYYQLAQHLEAMISNGVLQPGELIPGDQKMGALLCLNTWTVRKAFARLVSRGLVERTRKTGTFVKGGGHVHSKTVGFFYFVEAEIQMLRRAEFIQRCLSAHNFDLKIVAYGEDYFQKVSLLEEFRRMGLTGAIVVPYLSQRCREALLEVERAGFPYVRLGRSFFSEVLRAPLVRGNDRRCLNSALKYLWAKGHRAIGLIHAYRGDEAEQEYTKFWARRRGKEKWRMSVEFSGLPEQWKALPGPQMIRGYLHQNPELTAVLVSPSAAAVEVLRQGPVMGRNIPRDLSVLCLGDWDGLEATAPPITAMRLSDREMGETAAGLLLKILSGQKELSGTVLIDWHLVERGSVAELKVKSKTEELVSSVSGGG
ncbi:MAG TPA: GntR family transcriptional regulator [bacterium]|nr:GntR family transcriptional regulator [bacterium]